MEKIPIHIKVTEDQKWSWKKKAIDSKMSLTDYIIARVEGEC